MTIPGTQLRTDKNWRCYVSADNNSVKNLEGYDTYKPEKFAVRTLDFSNAADVYAGAKLSVKNVLGGPEDKRAAMFIHAIWLE